MPREREQGGHALVVRVAAGALGAAAGLAGPDAAVAGAGLAPVIEDVLSQFFDRLTGKRAERVAETLIDAAEELGGDTAEQLKRFVDAAASDETYNAPKLRRRRLCQTVRVLLARPDPVRMEREGCGSCSAEYSFFHPAAQLCG
jgi:hypothetical protein